MEKLLYHPSPDLPRILGLVALTLRLLLAAFFLFMATKNLAGNEQMAGDFARWGYPDWFRVLTACLQIGGAIVLLLPGVSFWGAVLLGCVLLGATFTRLRFDGAAAALVPLAFLVLTVGLAVIYRPPLLRGG